MPSSREKGQPLERALAFWRAVGLTCAGCAAALIAALALRPLPLVEVAAKSAPAPLYVAALADRDGRVVLLAWAARDSSALQLKRNGLAPIDAKTRAYELWGLPHAGAPQPLGLLPAEAKSALPLAAPAERVLGGFTRLAVSLEPAGGSRTGAPTGPLLYSGPCVRLW